MHKHAVALLFAAILCAASSALGASFLFYTGNGYVAGGNTDTVSSLDGFEFLVFPSSHTQAWFFIDDFATNPVFQDAQFFSVFLDAPSGSDLHVGDYPNATRAPFEAPGVPGLWFAANGRGDNEITGSFRILDIGFNPAGEIATLAVDFIQNDENGFLGQSRGSLRYNSDIPITVVSEPSTLAVALLLLAAFVYRAPRRRHAAPR